MKTVLYKPIFINPQAYVVFPQLYELQPKYDNYLEYAVFSGRLIVKDVNDESDKLTFENTKQINLNHFIGATVEIDQYTESGNTVLGRWEIPSNLHSSLVDAWFMSGISNADNPPFVKGVKGNKLQLKNFAYALSSGFGKYEVDFTKYSKINVTSDSISIYKEAGIEKGYATLPYNKLIGDVPSYFIKVKGINTGYINYYYRNDEGIEKIITYKKDGIYKIPMCYKEGTTGQLNAFEISTVNAVTITQLPSDYEGALVFDGVGDYAVCDNLPILTDYTLICRRVIEEIEGKNYSVASKSVTYRNGAFVFEQKYDAIYGTHSFGLSTLYTPSLQDSVIFQSTKNYNGKVIVRGTEVDTDKLYIGCLRDAAQCMKGAVYYFALYNKSLTTEEIEAEKVKLAKIWGSRL